MTILCPHCSTYRDSLCTSIGNTLKQTQQSALKPTTAWWLSWLRLALVGTWTWKKKQKTTSWNYQSAPSASVFIVLASWSAAARHPGGLSWSSWMLAAAPPLATSLSAPSGSVFIISDSGASAAEIGSSTINSTPSLCICLLQLEKEENLIRQYGMKCEVTPKSNCLCKATSWLVLVKLCTSCQNI